MGITGAVTHTHTHTLFDPRYTNMQACVSDLLGISQISVGMKDLSQCCKTHFLRSCVYVWVCEWVREEEREMGLTLTNLSQLIAPIIHGSLKMLLVFQIGQFSLQCCNGTCSLSTLTPSWGPLLYQAPYPNLQHTVIWHLHPRSINSLHPSCPAPQDCCINQNQYQLLLLTVVRELQVPVVASKQYWHWQGKCRA